MAWQWNVKRKMRKKRHYSLLMLLAPNKITLSSSMRLTQLTGIAPIIQLQSVPTNIIPCTQARHPLFVSEKRPTHKNSWERTFSTKTSHRLLHQAPSHWWQPNQASQSIDLDPLDNILASFCPRHPITSATAPTLPLFFVHFWDEPSRIGAGPSEEEKNSPDHQSTLWAVIWFADKQAGRPL